eukprot:bmy_00961T0
MLCYQVGSAALSALRAHCRSSFSVSFPYPLSSGLFPGPEGLTLRAVVLGEEEPSRSCVNAPLGGSSVIPEQTERATINLFSLFAHSTEFFPSRDQVLEQCLCDYHRGYPHRAHGPTLALPKKNAPATTEDTSLPFSCPHSRPAREGVMTAPAHSGGSGGVRLVSEASALFLLVEAWGNDVNLTRSTQAARGSLCRGFTQMKVRLLSNSHFPSSADSPTPQIHILSFIMIFSVWPRLLRSTFWLLGRGGGGGVSNNSDKPVRLRDSRGRPHRGSGTLRWSKPDEYFMKLHLNFLLQERFSHCGTPTLPLTPHAPYLLDHLWMLLHDMQKAVTLLVQGRRPLLGAT